MPETRILAARESRQARIEKDLTTHRSVVTVTANRPGWPKEDLISNYLTYRFFNFLRERLPEAGIESAYDDLGAFVLFKTDVDGNLLKQEALNLEEKDPLGRLIDIDVYTADGAPSRELLGLAPRTCLICADDARVCRRLGRHEQQDLQNAFESLFKEYLAALSFLDQLGLFAETALWSELCRVFGFGSITLNSSGSHADMQITHMTGSIRHVAAGIRSLMPEQMSSLDLLREHGRRVEADMLLATGGVNTHKGALFHLLIATAAVSSIRENLHRDTRLKRFAADLSEAVIGLAAPLLDDLKAADAGTTAVLSPGLQSYLRYGHAGARQEAIRGYEPLLTRWLPRFTAAPVLMPLLPEMLHRTWDTTTLKRGGFGMLQTLRQMALGAAAEEDLAHLSAWCEKHKLSTGGSADLIVLLYYVYLVFRFRDILAAQIPD